MEPEREIARVHGLGRGNLLGFSLIVTDRQIVGIDTRRVSVRLLLSMMLGLGLGMTLVVVVLFSGLEPVFFRISPLLSFVGMFSLVVSLLILMLVLVPRFLRKRIRGANPSTLQALKKDIIRIEVRRPSRITEKGYFTVRLLNGTSFSFWTVGQGMFDYVDSLLTSFAPGQVGDSSISTGPFTDRELDRPSNRLLVGIFAFVILLIVISVGILLPFLTATQVIGTIIGAVTVHALITIGYLSLRRSRRHRRRAL
jgi:membrane protein YdbS with pleckstrin-like domain